LVWSRLEQLHIRTDAQPIRAW